MSAAAVRNGEGRHPVVMLLLFVAVVIVSAGALAPVLWSAGKAFAAMVESRGWREVPVVGWFVLLPLMAVIGGGIQVRAWFLKEPVEGQIG